MRLSAMSFALLLPAVAFAQSPQGMNEQDLQKVLQQTQRLPLSTFAKRGNFQIGGRLPTELEG